MFLMEKRGIKLSEFVAVMFSGGEIPRRPNGSSSSHPKNNIVLGPRSVSLAQNKTD